MNVKPRNTKPSWSPAGNECGSVSTTVHCAECAWAGGQWILAVGLHITKGKEYIHSVLCCVCSL